MRLLEYEAKGLLKDSGIIVPDCRVITASPAPSVYTEPLNFPLVVKSQVPTGGRGKLGGVLMVRDKASLQQSVDTIGQLSIKGYTPRSLLIEQELDIDREYYLSLVINRTNATIDVIAHRNGGVEIEAQTDFIKASIKNKNFDMIGESLAELYALEDKSFLLAEWVERLYGCFIKNDATLIEINPLVLTEQGDLVAGDCKMTLDDDAVFRHPEWDFEDKVSTANFVTLDTQGTVATIANGAGLAMATVDAVTAAGLKPANFLDIGGNATVDKIVESFEQIIEFPHIDAIVINIFGGIVQCDTVAQAIIEARGAFPSLPTLYIRLSGNRSAEAAELLQHEQLPLYSSLEECIQELMR